MTKQSNRDQHQYNLTKTEKKAAKIEDLLASIIDVQSNDIDKMIADKAIADNLQAAIIGKGFSNHLTQITCDKTGQYIYTISNDEIKRLIAIHGELRCEEILEMRACAQIASHWLYTDGKSLDKLSKNDPVGYFTYSISNICKGMPEYIPMYQINNSTDLKQAVHINRHNDIAILYNNACEQPLNLIHEANELMRRFLSLWSSLSTTHTVSFTFANMTEIASNIPLWISELKSKLKEIISKALKAGLIKDNLDAYDILKLDLAYKGYSSYQGQRQIKGITNSEQVFDIVSSILDDIPSNAITTKPWKQREFTESLQSTKVKAIKIGSEHKLQIKANAPKQSLLQIMAANKAKGI